MKKFWVVYGIVCILVLVALFINYKTNYSAVCDKKGNLILPFENCASFPIYNFNGYINEIKCYGRQKYFKYNYYDKKGKFLFSLNEKLIYAFNDMYISYNFLKGKNSLYDSKGNLIISSVRILRHKKDILRIEYNDIYKTINYYNTKTKKFLFPKDNKYNFVFNDSFIYKKYIYLIINNKHGLSDLDGNIIVPCIFNHNIIDKFEDKYIYFKSNKFGLCDSNDKELIKEEFNYYFIINNKLYFTKDIIDKNKITNKTFLYENNKLKEIDYVISDQLRYQSGLQYKDNNYFKIYKNNKYGILYKNGEIIIPAKYDTIEILNKVNYFLVGKYINKTSPNMQEEPFNQNNIPVGIQSLYGLFDKNGKEILPCNYTCIQPIDKDFFIAQNKNNTVSVFNKNGKEIIHNTNINFNYLKIYKDKLISSNGIYDLNGNLLLDKVNIYNSLNNIVYIGKLISEYSKNNSNYIIDLDTMKKYKDLREYIIDKNPQLKNEYFEVNNEMMPYILEKHLFGREK